MDALEERVLAHAPFPLQDLHHFLARQRALQLLPIQQLLLKLLEGLRCAPSAHKPSTPTTNRNLLAPSFDELSGAAAIATSVARNDEVSYAA